MLWEVALLNAIQSGTNDGGIMGGRDGRRVFTVDFERVESVDDWFKDSCLDHRVPNGVGWCVCVCV